MKKVDLNELTRKFNKFRCENVTRSFTNSELHEALKELGFSKAICHKMVTKGFVTFEKIGTSRIYQFTKEPVHKSRFEQIYHEMRTKCNGYHHKKVEQSSSISEELAVKTLQAAGYKLQKCVGFDLEKFKSEQPGMYWRYMQYKDVL